MSTDNIKVMSTYKKYNSFYSKIRTLHFRLNLPFKSIWYGKWKKEIKKYEKIIVFDYVLENDIIKYLEKKQAKRIIFWYWNTISKNDPRVFRSNICEFWSFDKLDCEKYHLKYNNQFYFPVERYKENNIYDVSFVGIDKGRADELIKLKYILNKKNLLTKFIIVGDKNTNVNYYKDHITNESISYMDLINIIKKSKCLLDITKMGQSGLTLRVLESIFYSKKLITNNKSIIEYDFYNSNNIFILNFDDIDKIDEFILSPYIEIDEDIKKRYTYETWINNFENKN